MGVELLGHGKPDRVESRFAIGIAQKRLSITKNQRLRVAKLSIILGSN